MPLAHYPTFAACVADYRSQGYSEEEARRICGAMERDAKQSSDKQDDWRKSNAGQR